MHHPSGRRALNRRPTAVEVEALAAELGLTLRAGEADACSAALVEFGELAGLRAPAPVVERDRGRPPAADEDPYRAWLWRSSIEGRPGGLLAGRTVGFKDHIAVAGLPLTFNARPLEHHLAEEDAGVVRRVLDAGGTITGKHALSGIVTQDHAVAHRGPPLNPCDPARVTGGSSSGSAVAVAAGEVDVAFGGDQGGSVRVPAAYCGVVGLKPTYGLVSHAGATFHSDPTLDHIGIFGRRVLDVARALEAVAGYDERDPCQDRTIPDRVDVLAGLEAGVGRLRVGVLKEGFGDTVDPEIASGVRAAIALLRKMGADVTEVSVPEHRTVHPAISVTVAYGVRTRCRAGAEGSSDPLERLLATHTGDLVPYLKVNLLAAELSWRADGGAALTAAARVRAQCARAYDGALSGVDVLVMPTTPTVAPALSAPGDGRTVAQNTRPFNFTGHPALAVPCGTARGLPISMQIVGRHLDDALLLRVAYTHEQATSG